jgi:uncharacterized Zn-binding protein involved in type VI secretion
MPRTLDFVGWARPARIHAHADHAHHKPQMQKRYLITLGAPTSSGGKVTTATSGRLIAGVPVALEGDRVHCPHCGADGEIKPDGPRLTERWNGREVALQDDLCMCKCSPSPKLVSAQDVVCQLVG